ncbi:RNA 2',3'-cyclic phosphodiesterase [Thermodesulfobacteriota bacterium]
MVIRSFLAFELPPEIRKTLSDVSGKLKRTLPDVRWVKPENIHLTLVFMGNFPVDMIDPAGQAFEEISKRYAPFRIQLRGIGTFGGTRNPRVLWAGINGNVERMGAFRDELQQKSGEFGVIIENRRFKPHLTLARFKKKKNQGSNLEPILFEHNKTESPFTELKELIFFKSELKEGGAIYTKLKSFHLTGDL